MPRPMCTCIYCGKPFSPGKIGWRISGDAEHHAADFEKAAYDSLKAALDGFQCTDKAGQGFLRVADTPPASRKVRLVAPPDPKSDSSKKRFGRGSNKTEIFVMPAPRDSDFPTLHFSKKFVERLHNYGNGIPEDVIDEIERNEIYPVCPFCSSDLPRVLLSQREPVRVVKLGLIGPAESGKTSLNTINILFECLNCDGWKVEDRYVSPHHLLTDNYYESLLSSEKLPSKTPDCYIPPLLLWLKKGDQNVLLSLLDIPSSRLQRIREDVINNKHNLPMRTEFYIKQFRQMDGWLLMLDAEREILPQINAAGYGAAPEDQETLGSLLQIFSRLSELQHKPAALVITKCDLLFTEAVGKEREDMLFETFSPIERVLWQKPWAEWQRIKECEQSPGRKDWHRFKQGRQSRRPVQQPEEKDTYLADRHEMIQFSFKPFIKRWFPELAGQLEQDFSRVDIFPESSWGSFLRMLNIQEKQLNKDWVKPFYSAEPIFWLLDIIP